MNTERDIRELEMRLYALEIEYKSTIKMVKGSLIVFAVVLLIFFGLTYEQIGEVSIEAVKNFTKTEVFNAAAQKVDEQSRKAISDIQNIVANTANESKVTLDGIKKNLEESEQISQNFEAKANEIAIKYDNLLTLLNSNKRDAEAYLKKIKDAVPKFSPFSVIGKAEDGDTIKPPWGTTRNWNLFIAPKNLEFYLEGVQFSPEYSFLGANLKAEDDGKDGWTIKAKSIHKFGNSIVQSPAEVSYLLTPTGIVEPESQ